MSCKNLLPPSPPTLEELPSNIKLPNGFDANKLKGLASGGGLSGAMNSVGGMISSGLKQAGAALSPAALGAKLDSLVGGISNTISSTVNGAIGGISNLKNRLKSFDPSAQLSKLAGAPGAIMNEIQGKLTGFDEFSSLENSVSSGKCAQDYINQASKVTGGLKQSAAAASAGITRKDRLKMAKDTNFKLEKEKEITEQVTQSAKAQATAAATSPDKESKNTQSKLQSDELTVVSVAPKEKLIRYYDSYISPFKPGWSADDARERLYSVVIDTHIKSVVDTYIANLGAGISKLENEPVPGQQFHEDSIEWVDVRMDISKYTLNRDDLRQLWFKSMGQTDPEDFTWESSDEYSNPRHMMVGIQTETLNNAEDIITGMSKVTTVSYIALAQTLDPDTHPVFGNWTINSMSTKIMSSLGDTPLEAYKNSVKYSLDTLMKGMNIGSLVEG